MNVDWVRLLESGTIIQSVKTFYDIVNNIIDQNVPNFPSSSSHYPHPPGFPMNLLTLHLRKSVCMQLVKDPVDFTPPLKLRITVNIKRYVHNALDYPGNFILVILKILKIT